MNTTPAARHDESADWEAVAPLLESALDRLGAPDRDAVLLRFIQGKSHRDVGQAMGISEDAARKRIERALTRLRDFFNSRGTREERSKRFQAENYVQHNPRALRIDEITGATGRQAWVKAFEEAAKRKIALVDLGGIALRDPIIVMAECDLVTAIYKGTLPDPDNPGRTYEAFAFETVRVKDGKFTEHWDQVTLAAGWMNGPPPR